MHCIINTILAGALILLLLGAIDMLYARSQLLGEQTRRIIHVAAGLVTLAFPLLLCNHWHLLGLATIFTLLMIFTDRIGVLPSVHRINRFSLGAFVYPGAIYGCFLAYTIDGRLIFYFIPVLIMVLCDPLAGLVGSSLKKIPSEKKTLAGSLAFGLGAFVICILLFMGITNLSLWQALTTGFLIALATAAVEHITYKGLDNLTIPAVAILLVLLVDQAWRLG